MPRSGKAEGENVLDELLQFGDGDVVVGDGDVVLELQQVRLIEYIVAAEEELRNLPNTGGELFLFINFDCKLIQNHQLMLNHI